MEFDDLKKIWDAQTDKPLYAINEGNLHKRVLSKMKTGQRISNVSELLTIIVYLCGGLLILILNVTKELPVISLYLLSIWMFMIAFYAIASRVYRLSSAHQYDRSMNGDLQHALSLATYQVRFSQLMRWNILPIVLLICLAAWESGRFFWLGLVTSVFILVANYAAGWEHNIYKSRKKELQILKAKLEDELSIG